MPNTARFLLAALAFLPAALADMAASVPNCCKELSETPGLGGKVFLPGSAEYESRMGSYWSESAALRPWCVVLPSSTEDVSTVVKAVAAHDCPFGVRGGGHGSFAESNSVEHGVTIDFGNMNTTTYDADRKLASVPPGTHWQDVYDTLAPHGVVVTGGRAGTVGTAGFITGGGNSFHSASHGFACDNVANYEVVLGDGRIVNANSSENADLWRALKGSSANLGLVTRFDMYAIDFPDPKSPVVWGGNLIYDLSAGPGVVDALVEFADNVHSDENSSSIVYWAYLPQLGGMMLNAALENTLAHEKPPAFDPYYAAGNITNDTTKVDRMSTVTNELGAGQPAGFRNVWFTSAFDNDAAVMNHAVDRFYALNKELEDRLGAASGYNTLCMFQPLTRSLVAQGEHRGGNVLGLDRWVGSKGNGILFLATLAYNGADLDEPALDAVHAYTADVEAFASNRGALWDWKYPNYAHRSQDPISTFGPDNIALLRAASAKYDPAGVFQRLRKTGFHIPSEQK